MKFPYQKLPILQDSDPQKPKIARPYVPVYLHGPRGKTDAPFYALLDSGADQVLLPAELAEVVGIDDFKNTKQHSRTVGVASQVTETYYHDLHLQIEGDTRTLPTTVGFAEDVVVPLLGRALFKHFRLVIFDEAGEQVDLKT